MKKIIALVLALSLILASGAVAFAATGAQTPDKTVTVGGLDAGDVVKFYKLIKWVPGDGWAWEDGVAAAATAAGVTVPTLRTITGYLDTTTDPATLVDGVISKDDAGILAQIAQKLTAADTETVAESATTVTYTQPAYADGATDAEKEAADVAFMGLYCALVTSASPNYLYNPIFVSADYNPDATNTNSITVEEGTLSYQPAALAKKEEVTLKKESGDGTDVMWDVAIGDTIPFTITSIIPAYSTSYVDPVYEITDKMSSGLVLDSTSIIVKVKEKTATEFENLAATNYSATPNAATNPTGFTVALTKEYLQANTSPKDIQITYNAKVTEIPDENVVQKENEATVKFSNDPGNKNSYSLLEDRTNHYTFSIDANLLGHSGWENSELVKIGLNPDGTEITQEKLSNGTMAGVLEGAVFGLYTDPACTTLYTNTNVDPAITGEYTSDPHGKLNISGLDAGTYYLKEISAPAGYIKSTDIWEIKITPHYTEVAAGSYVNADGIKVNYDKYDYLDSYKVDVKNLTTNTTVTSNFTIENEGTYKKTATKADVDETTKLANTRGTELPSTGGIGTTIFYIVGGLLLVGAAVILVARKKSND